MGRKKKEQSITETKAKVNQKSTTTENIMFHVVAETNNAYLRRKPLLEDNNKILAGRMVKGQIYDVVAEIDFAVRKMYRLKEGYYVIADNNIKKV
jgi:hypothetical protein